jgi:signal transduction histidine kinase
MTGTLSEFLQQYPGAGLQLDETGTVLDSNGIIDELVGQPLAGVLLTRVLEESSHQKWHRLLTNPGVRGEVTELAFVTPHTVEERRFLAVRSLTQPVFWLIEQPRDPKMEKLYQELSSLNSELSTMQRQVARDRSRLQRALQVAEAAVRTRNDVLAIVSHDLRNPMNTIRMAAGLLELDIAEDKKALQVHVIIRSVERMTTLINDLLDLGAIEEGKFRIERGMVQVRALLAEVQALQETQANEKQLELTWDVTGDVDSLPADHNRLLQALLNVVGNAVKFTPAGGSVHVRAVRSGDAVRFSVADTGPGIAAENASNVFDRYWHAAHKAQGGSGLGLAITKAIVEAHGGQIWVDTKRTKGTEICWTIPLITEGKSRARRVDTPSADG